MVAIAPSVETLVLVLLLLNGIAILFPAKEPNNDLGIEPDLIACLCKEALRTRVVNSDTVRSAIERRCLGPNGEDGKVAGEERFLLDV